MKTKWYFPGALHQHVFDFLRLHCQNAEDLEDFAKRHNEKHPAESVNLGGIKIGLITQQQLVSYFLEQGGGQGVRVGNELARIYDSLIYWDVFSEIPFSRRQLYDFQINFPMVQYLQSTGVLENIVKGPAILAPKYYPATAAIVIEKDHQESIGTGSVVCHGGETFILTNRHVVNLAEGIALKSIFLGESVIAPPVSGLIVSEIDDLGAFRIPVPAAHPRFFLSEVSFLLQDVLLLGFPKIPFTNRPHLTVHSGEINATIETRRGEQLYLISNYASPGSSGGPLIDYRGMLVGVVSERLEGEYGDNHALFQHSAAVTLDRVRRFIESEVFR